MLYKALNSCVLLTEKAAATISEYTLVVEHCLYKHAHAMHAISQASQAKSINMRARTPDFGQLDAKKNPTPKPI